MSDEDPLFNSVVDCLSREGMLVGRQPNDASGLLREKGCVKQAWHIDFPDRSAWPEYLPHLPRTAWVVLEQGSALEVGVMPSAIALMLSSDQLQVGDIVLFDGDVPHRGVAFPDASNVSMHMYLDVPGVKRVRNLNRDGSFSIVKPHVGFKY
jgi:hypothetical protein